MRPPVGAYVEILPPDAISVIIGYSQYYYSMGIHYMPEYHGGKWLYRAVD